MSRTVAYKGYANAVRRFDAEPSPGRQRNRFNYAKKRLMTFDAGYLVPFFWMPCLPGDSLKIRTRALVRASNAFVAPLMDEIWVSFYFFKTYNRFVFVDWNAFMGELIQDDPDYDDSGTNNGGKSLTRQPFNSPDEYVLPTMIIKPGSDGLPAFPVHSLLDQLALPYAVGNDGYEIQTLLPRHCNLIYNEYFRDENLQDFAPVPKGIGSDAISMYQLMPSTKYADYFTGSLPFLQKGPSVNIGLVGDIPVVPDGLTLGLTDGVNNFGLIYSSDGNRLLAHSNDYGLPAGSAIASGSSNPKVNTTIGPASSTGYKAQLSSADYISLAQVRLGFQMQRFYEGQARSGTRYIEYIRFMFDEFIPDVQLLRPEFIGGGKMLLNVNPVAQTSADSTTPLGTLGAFGVRFDDKIFAQTHCNEHGYIIGFLTISTTLTYQQGLNRDFSRRDRFDFYTPTLAHLAEQAVLNKEVCCTGLSDYDNDVFGYIGRYDEYRTMHGEVTGYFRSNAMIPGTTTKVSLDAYHLSQFWDVSNPGSSTDNYPGLPHLNSEFLVQPKNVIDRALGITSDAPGVPQFLGDIVTTVKGSRVISKYGIPGFADHF